jgi:hypothetical protein
MMDNRLPINPYNMAVPAKALTIRQSLTESLESMMNFFKAVMSDRGQRVDTYRAAVHPHTVADPTRDKIYPCGHEQT